ncbi:glycosyltransferase family 2 protein [Trebonia kvetii]|uniref:Glycosyltransferase family 2 protein n=1 Tax=Trebonia kvetii TaxID=2480626 RepID=A0A6P2BRK5_9ACTN|nr:glycosyltransferase family 2 protein [Trebonia kvetii]TVZ01644.1 glycosyltransferase family 2 protein [Trebonia kvetii]
MLAVAVLVVSIVLFAMAFATLWWMMHAWRTPETLASTSFAKPVGETGLSFTLLLPIRHERQDVVENTVQKMLESSHDKFEIVIITGADDPETTGIAERLATIDPDRITTVIDPAPRNKSTGLNSALLSGKCHGDVIGVFDAEDVVHPDLLTHVDHAFRSENADVVQGGVQLLNFYSSWYSLRNCLEYFFWFRSRLHLQAEKGFITLGGNTVFVKRELLEPKRGSSEQWGWDETCLAEDCELGVRLSSAGKKVVVAYSPEMVTREETPDTITSFVKQRTRWNQGFLQVYRKGTWKRLPTNRQRWLARFTLSTPFYQAASGLAVPIGIAIGVFVKVPMVIAMISWMPAIPAFLVLAFEVAALRDFGKEYFGKDRADQTHRVRGIHYLKLIVSMPFFQILLMFAALRAVWRELRGRTNWELTEHVGAHLNVAASTSATTSV